MFLLTRQWLAWVNTSLVDYDELVEKMLSYGLNAYRLATNNGLIRSFPRQERISTKAGSEVSNVNSWQRLEGNVYPSQDLPEAGALMRFLAVYN